MRAIKSFAAGCCLLALTAVDAGAASRAELEARIVQLERKLDNRGLLELLEQVRQLQEDVQSLRGQIEVQSHEIETMQSRQRDLYLDIDRRLQRLEAGGVSVPADAGVIDPMGGGAPSAAAPGTPGTSPSPDSSAPAAVLNPAEERKDYDAALELLKEGRYDDAAGAFQNFLKEHPNSSYADNAQYWLGEVFYVTRAFQRALEEFGKVLQQYPDSGKAADAKLKMGYIHYELKNWQAARDSLSRVVSEHAGTTTARLAQERLDRIKSEGH